MAQTKEERHRKQLFYTLRSSVYRYINQYANLEELDEIEAIIKEKEKQDGKNQKEHI